LFGQKVKNFFTDLTDTDKKEIFRKILQLDDYVLYYNETVKRIKQISESLDEIKNKLSVDQQLLSDAKFQIVTLNKVKSDFEINKAKDIEEYQNTIVRRKSEIDSLFEEVEEVREQTSNLEKLSEEVVLVEKEISIIDSGLVSFYQDLGNKKRLKISELQNKMLKRSDEIKTKYDELRDELRSTLGSEKDEINSELLSLSEERNKLENKVASIETKITSLDERSVEIKESVIDKEIATCPTCEQKIGPSTIRNLEEKREQIKNEILNLGGKKEEIEFYIRTIIRKHDDLVIKVSENNQKKENELNVIDINESSEIQKVQEQYDKLVEQVEQLSSKKLEEETKKSSNEMELLKLKKQDLETEIGNIKSKIGMINKLEKQISDIESGIKTVEGFLARKQEEKFDESQLNFYTEKVESIEEEIRGLETQKSSLEDDIVVLEFWKVGFSSVGIPSLLIDESIPFMNMKVSYYLDKISNGRYIVSFDTLKATKEGEFRDKISVNVLDNLTKANSRVKLSGGQTRLVDIATILTLCDLQNDIQDIKFNIVLFDEIFDSLDDENITYVSNLLRTLVVDKSINIISHRHIDQIDADEVLSFF